MDCHDAKIALSPYFDRELPRAEAASIAAHLTVCDSCRHRFEQLCLVSAVIRTQLAGRDMPSPDLCAKVVAALDDVPPMPVAQRAIVWTRLLWRRVRRIRLMPGPADGE
jgi:predicted anti-sigma-YlaC factor YlaD